MTGKQVRAQYTQEYKLEAVANKMARTVWAILAKGVAFDQVKWNPTETVTT